MGHDKNNQKCCWILASKYYFSPTWVGPNPESMTTNVANWCDPDLSLPVKYADINGDGKADMICD